MKCRRHRKESEITSVGSSPLFLIFEVSMDTTEHGKNLYLFYILPQLNPFCQHLRHLPDVMMTITTSFSHPNSSATKIDWGFFFFLPCKSRQLLQNKTLKFQGFFCLFVLSKKVVSQWKYYHLRGEHGVKGTCSSRTDCWFQSWTTCTIRFMSNIQFCDIFQRGYLYICG